MFHFFFLILHLGLETQVNHEKVEHTIKERGNMQNGAERNADMAITTHWYVVTKDTLEGTHTKITGIQKT